ncbi:hypothetical protein CEXT_688391 [Caerostris extrusa]|uniref:Maturase K n=1 Tax=Caerostris extrusa TaxID=172846 RepID=A0AAV4W690_CAEEX|nr:hypothetical protein CEXT_688391 [Caerostris extrusa]
MIHENSFSALYGSLEYQVPCYLQLFISITFKCSHNLAKWIKLRSSTLQAFNNPFNLDYCHARVLEKVLGIGDMRFLLMSLYFTKIASSFSARQVLVK